MQIYTKILLGMVIGVLLGATLGPTSVLLNHDLYIIRDPANVHLRENRLDPSSTLTLPANRETRLAIIETETEARMDLLGRTQRVPVWAHVRFSFTTPQSSTVKHQETWRQGWLQINSKPLPTGGFHLSPTPVSRVGELVISCLSPIGTVFLRLLRMVIVPLVFTSLVVGVASLGDIRKLGRLGGRALGLYLITTALAVSIGLVCASTIQPGSFVAETERTLLLTQFAATAGEAVSAVAEAPSLLTALLSLIPTNPLASFTNGDMLQIIFFAVAVGVALTTLRPEVAAPVVAFCDSIQHAMIAIIHAIMLLAPFGVAALVAEVVGASGLSILKALVVYSMTVLLGLLLHVGIIYGGLVRFFGIMSWSAFLQAIRPAQLIAFSTSSSSATLPVSLECAQKRLGVNPSVSSFVLPLGATVNMDGTALYQGVAALFIAQVFHLDLSFIAQLSIVLTATLASIGAAGVPGAGMITLMMVLTTAGIPPSGIALILGVDRLLDMFRSAVNVTGDLTVAAVLDAREGKRAALGASGRIVAEAVHEEDKYRDGSMKQ
jgi:Na+/H+-dicarboxylate symporter